MQILMAKIAKYPGEHPVFLQVPLTQKKHFLLQDIQETCCLASIHLYMMELERYGQSGLEPPFSVSSPNQERIIELTAILVYYAVNLCLNKSGRTDNHVVFKENALTFAGSLYRQHLVIAMELL